MNGSTGTWSDANDVALYRYIVEFSPQNFNDVITGGAGNDAIEGGLGRDTAIFSGVAADYSIVNNGNGTWTVTDNRGGSPDGIDTLSGVELFRFTDQSFDTTLNSFNTAPTDLELIAPGNNLVAQPISNLHYFTSYSGFQHNAVPIAGGGYAIMYVTYDYNSGWDLMVQRYDSANTPVGVPELLDRNMLSHSQYETDVTVLTDGKIVVVWRDSGWDGSGEGVYFKVYDANFNAITPRIKFELT
jgi:hypothetical protein